MNFLGSLTSALEAVGEVVAPISEEDRMIIERIKHQQQDDEKEEMIDSDHIHQQEVVEDENGMSEEMLKSHLYDKNKKSDVVGQGHQEKTSIAKAKEDNNISDIKKVTKTENVMAVEDTVTVKLRKRNEYLEENEMKLNKELQEIYEQQEQQQYHQNEVTKKLTNQIQSKENEIKKLYQQLHDEQRRAKSAFGEVESLSNDLRETLQSSTKLKILLDEEMTSKKRLEEEYDKLKLSLENSLMDSKGNESLSISNIEIVKKSIELLNDEVDMSAVVSGQDDVDDLLKSLFTLITKQKSICDKLRHDNNENTKQIQLLQKDLLKQEAHSISSEETFKEKYQELEKQNDETIKKLTYNHNEQVKELRTVIENVQKSEISANNTIKTLQEDLKQVQESSVQRNSEKSQTLMPELLKEQHDR